MSTEFPDKIRSLPAFEGRFDAHRLAAGGADVWFASYPAGTTIEPHSHDTDNCGVVTRGELILTLDGCGRRVSDGGWHHAPSVVLHVAEFEVDTKEIESWFAVNRA